MFINFIFYYKFFNYTTKRINCVAAIDFKNKTVTYTNTENEEKIEAGDILLFVDRDKISQHKEPETQNSKTGVNL